jgi:hypothetical protein
MVKNNINERTRPVEDAMEKARKKAEKREKNEV